MSECTHDCSTCSSNCSERKAESLLAALNPKSTVKKVIAERKGQVEEIYRKNHWGRVPAWLMTKVKKNWKKGYTQNQPDYH